MRLFLGKDQHDITSHSLLCNQHFFFAINNEVTTLIVATLSCIFNDLLLSHTRQMTKFRTYHYRYFSNQNFVVFVQTLF